MSDMTLQISDQLRATLALRLPDYIQLKNETEIDKNSDKTLDKGFAVEAGNIGAAPTHNGSLTFIQSFTFTLTQKFNGTENVEAIKADLFEAAIEQLKYFTNTKIAGLSGIRSVEQLQAMESVFIKESVIAVRTTLPVIFSTRF
ncbi:MAG: hypothetical protein ACPGJV_02725 [Bacteriovoracaceae bacterium]